MAKKIIASIFNDEKNAQNVVDQLESIKSADVSLFTKDNYTAYKSPDNAEDNKIVTIVNPNNMSTQNLGVDQVGGPLVGIISEDLMASMLGGYSNYGLPESHDENYKSDVADGSIYCKVIAKKEDIKKITQILEQNNAINIQVQ